MPQYNPNKELTTKLFDLGVFTTTAYGVGILAITSTFLYRFPYSSILIGSEIPANTFGPFRIFIVYIFPHYIFTAACSVLSSLMILIWIDGVLLMPFLLKQLRTDRKEYKTRSNLRNALHLIKIYRSAQILQIKVNKVLEYCIVPTQALVLDLILFASVMLIKFGSKLSPASKCMLTSWAILGAVAWAAALIVGGHMHWYGIKVLKSWKYTKWSRNYHRLLMSKFRKSCRPLTISYGKTYVIRRLSVLKFIRGISKGIMRTLLTLK